MEYRQSIICVQVKEEIVKMETNCSYIVEDQAFIPFVTQYYRAHIPLPD